MKETDEQRIVEYTMPSKMHEYIHYTALYIYGIVNWSVLSIV